MGTFYEAVIFMKIKVLSITESDVDIFWKLFAEILLTQFPGYSQNVQSFMLEKMYTRNSFIYWLQNSIKTVLLAYANDQPVGFMVIDEPYGGVSFCRWLGIKKRYQKKGIGTILIQQWLDMAHELGCHKVEVASQPAAREFYKRIGLTEEGFRKCSYFGIDQYAFGKVIGEPTDEVMTRKL